MQDKNTHNFKDKLIQSNIHIEKRSYERVRTNMDVRFYCGNMFYSGTAINISKGGMLIKTGNCLPITSGIVVIMFYFIKISFTILYSFRYLTLSYHPPCFSNLLAHIVILSKGGLPPKRLKCPIISNLIYYLYFKKTIGNGAACL